MNTKLGLFAFGTLMDADVLHLVARQSVSELVLEPARVNDHACRWVHSDDYPVLVPHAGEQTTGLIIRGLSAEAMERIEFYEGEVFTLRQLTVVNARGQLERCQFFSHSQQTPATDRPWLLAEWQESTKPAMLSRVERYMACFGRMSAAEADTYW